MINHGWQLCGKSGSFVAALFMKLPQTKLFLINILHLFVARVAAFSPVKWLYVKRCIYKR